MLMKIKFISFCASALLAAGSAQASGPQLVFDSGDDNPYVAEISGISKVEFRKDGLNIHSTEERLIPYSSLKKLAFDFEGTHTPTAVKTIRPDAGSFRISVSRDRNSVALHGTGGETRVSIYSISGTMVLDMAGYNGGDIDISALPSGIYILKTSDNCAKFIK